MTSLSPNDVLGPSAPYHFVFPSQFPSSCPVPTCETHLGSFEQLAEHEAVHATNRKNVCYVCHYTFSSAQALRIHLNTQYVKAGLYQCNCGTVYADPSRRSRCSKSHTTIFRCPRKGCDYRNPRKDLVVGHLATCYATPAEPIAEVCWNSGPPKHLPGREPRELRRRTDEVLNLLTDMELMCKTYNQQRLAALVEHFLSFERYDLAEATNQNANSTDGHQAESRGSSIRHTKVTKPSAGSDTVAYGTADNEYPTVALSHLPIFHEAPRDEETNTPVFPPGAGLQMSMVAVASDNIVDHGPAAQSITVSPELESMLAQLCSYPNEGPLGAGPSDWPIDTVAGAHWQGLGTANYYGDSRRAPTASETQYGEYFHQETTRNLFFQ